MTKVTKLFHIFAVTEVEVTQ
uniref:Uncharacterized protein n=1 Tax=Rhizophora mucronata TaxID=61149 RepID=A0A2P2QR60_RHIMU